MTGRGGRRQAHGTARQLAPLDLIHRSNCSNPHQHSLSGRLPSRFQPRIGAGVEFGCDLCQTGCDARPGCRAGLTPDQLAGMTWWNGLSEADRRFWLACAVSAVPGDAWEAFKRAKGGLDVGGT